MGWLWFTAIFRVMDNTNAVLPIEGRAAIITRSEGCQPEVTSSKALKPEGTPLNPSARLPAISIPLIASSIKALIAVVSFLYFPRQFRTPAFGPYPPSRPRLLPRRMPCSVYQYIPGSIPSGYISVPQYGRGTRYEPRMPPSKSVEPNSNIPDLFQFPKRFISSLTVRISTGSLFRKGFEFPCISFDVPPYKNIPVSRSHSR